MPKFQVTVGRDRTEYTLIEIEAETVEAAKGNALSSATHNAVFFNWTLDRESIIGEPYVSGDPVEMPDE